MLKLLILLTAFSVAPASAGRRLAEIAPTPAVITWSDDSVACPYERARLAALEADGGGPTTITLTDRVPPDSSLLGGMGHGSGVLAP
jgi:hypothetical protein